MNPHDSKCWPWSHRWVWAEKEVEEFSRPAWPDEGLSETRVNFSQIVQYGSCSRCGMVKRRRIK